LKLYFNPCIYNSMSFVIIKTRVESLRANSLYFTCFCILLCIGLFFNHNTSNCYECWEIWEQKDDR